MNKEIFNRPNKFRVWHDGTKTWVHGPHENSSMDGVNLFGETILLGAFMNGIGIMELNDCISLEYTGIKDDDEKEIFEGDIIKTTEGDVGYVVYYKCGFWIKGLEGMKDWKGVDFPLYGLKTILNGGKVIGNVFDNPDLIKE